MAVEGGSMKNECRLCSDRGPSTNTNTLGFCFEHSFELSDHTCESDGAIFLDVYCLNSERTYAVVLTADEPSRPTIAGWQHGHSSAVYTDMPEIEEARVRKWVRESRAVFAVVVAALEEARFARMEA
jgi:hypothetical protein